MDLGKILEPMDSAWISLGQDPSRAQKSELWLPVPMTDMQKTLMDQVVALHYSDILKLFETTEPVMPESLETLYTNSQLVCSHPYLLVEDQMPHNLLLKDVPAELARESGKFRVLGDLLDTLKNEKVHIALFARPGKTFDLLEAFLLGRFINYRRYHGERLTQVDDDDDDDLSTVHLIPSSQLSGNFTTGNDKFAMVIAFDQTFDEDDGHVQSVRQSSEEGLPVIRFIAQNSVEHVSHMFKHTEDQFLRHVLAAVVVLRDKIGELPKHVAKFYDQNLSVLLEWFHQNTGWPMPELPPVSTFGPLDVEKSLLTEISSPRGGGAEDESSLPHSRDYYQTKRLKRQVLLNPENTFSHAMLAKMNSLLEDKKIKTAEVDNLRSQAAARQVAFEQLMEEMGERVTTIQELQNRVGFAEKRAERKAADAERAQLQVEELTLELAQFKEENPDNNNQTERIKQLEAEVKRMNERLETRTAENEYTRNEYQKASSAAADAHTALEQITSERNEISHKLESNMVELRKLTFDDERKQKDEQIRDLKRQNALLTEQLRRMMETSLEGNKRVSRRNTPVPSTVNPMIKTTPR